MLRTLCITMALWLSHSIAYADSYELLCPDVLADNPFVTWEIRNGEGWTGHSRDQVYMYCTALIEIRDNNLLCTYSLAKEGVLVHHLRRPQPEGATCDRLRDNRCGFQCETPAEAPGPAPVRPRQILRDIIQKQQQQPPPATVPAR